MATKIKAHNLHTDVKAILDSKATTTQLAAKADISALAAKTDSDTVVAALANKLTIELDYLGRPTVRQDLLLDSAIWFTGPTEWGYQQPSTRIVDSAYNLQITTYGSVDGRGGSVIFQSPVPYLGMQPILTIDRQDNYGVSILGPLRLADSKSITLGADSDFTITHDGTNNIINSIGPGDLFIQDAGVNKLALDANGIIVYGSHRVVGDVSVTGAIQSTASGTPTITSASNIIFNADSGNGIINFSGSKIINIANPIGAQDAASKSYVDSVNYKDSDVDTHLNTSTATVGEVLSWSGTDYNWVSQSGGASGGSTTVNTIYVDSDIKMLDTGAILTISPGGSGVDPYTGQTVTWPEQNRFEKKVETLSWGAGLYAMFFHGMLYPVPIYSSTNKLLSADITIHIATYGINSANSGYDSDFADSQIIQGHLMHNHTTATFTQTSNVCTDPGVNLINLSTSISSGGVSLDFQMAQEKLTRYTVHSRAAMQLNNV